MSKGYYVASKTSHAWTWKELREKGASIVSSWIDEAGEGQTDCLASLWLKIGWEIAEAKGVVFYAHKDDSHWKGSFVEVGIALGMNKPVAVILTDIALEPKTFRPIGSWVNHPRVMLFEHGPFMTKWRRATDYIDEVTK